MQLIGEGLSAVRDTLQLFENLSFELEGGQSLLVIGENGTGKSTLLRIIAGLLRPHTGAVRFVADDMRNLRDSMHYLSHQNAMKPNLSVQQNLAFWEVFDRAEKKSQLTSIDAALDKVGLLGKEALPFGVLSTGQKRRVAIARLLLNDRPVWLLDEPTAGLDARSTETLAHEMRLHTRKGGIVIAATHLPLGLDEGMILRLGEPV
ncbi:heme ABC exporter ATP-binding protein CcmA [Limoniibacter endophyticus]|uniref:Cytochrome c biogenesis ATP-binding export protein CcmA n=1 Tax=Limoniibacter endophyticus TaxID=1565040 RepID=A0A8J3GI16_9HYPH|nr:heme ABC exporter ATP-binding protein CcmA [Limoniibacter endophyticus]GHC74250.1 cytochrome c biogenesis ATP-binding export protein CcmA [Limoniibacter endophyticus]